MSVKKYRFRFQRCQSLGKPKKNRKKIVTVQHPKHISRKVPLRFRQVTQSKASTRIALRDLAKP